MEALKETNVVYSINRQNLQTFRPNRNVYYYEQAKPLYNKLEGDELSNDFELIWTEHGNYVRRILIGLTRDMDLADDLTQDTYLRAAVGFAGYRGGDARAWLGVIARNVHHQHFRRKYTRSERPFSDAIDMASERTVGSSYDVAMIDVRQAIADLDPTLRTALIMKHCGGFTYKEIAAQQDCPDGTVKWRVSAALDRLRIILGVAKQEKAAMKCKVLVGAKLLDYIEGTLSKTETEQIRLHLVECHVCRERAQQIGEVLLALDEVEAVHKATAIVEIDDQGYSTGYMWMSWPNTTDDPMETITIHQNGVEYMTIQGEELCLEPLNDEPAKDEMQAFSAYLPHPIPLGEVVRMHTVVRHPPGLEAARKLENGRWRFGPGNLTLTEKLLYTAAIRLPKAATLVESVPEPDEIRSKDQTTIVWRGTLPPDKRFEFSVEYALGE